MRPPLGRILEWTDRGKVIAIPRQVVKTHKYISIFFVMLGRNWPLASRTFWG